MRTLYLLRHSLTEANERRLYCGATDLPLSPAGRALALSRRVALALPACDLCATSGMRRADETLGLLTGRVPDTTLPDLREMDFGAFEMRAYEALKGEQVYQRWIVDETGEVACPGGESRNGYRARVLSGGDRLLRMEWQLALLVVHGGSVAALMAHWFPDEPRGFYDWQPSPCGGWTVTFDGTAPIGYEEL